MASARATDATKRKALGRGKPTAKGQLTKTSNSPKTGAIPEFGLPADDHEMSQVFSPRPVHLRLLAAFEGALQDGVNPTDTVIAKKLGVSRETVNRWRRRSTDLWHWVHEHIGQRALKLKPIVDRRVTELAISGSPEHTKLYYQYVAKVGSPYGDPDAPVRDDRIVVNHNYLVPRPDYSQLPAVGPVVSSTPAASLTPGSAGPPAVAKKKIPVISVRPA